MGRHHVSTSYGIAEVARRSGFNPSTLRYYETIGLLPAPARTDAGYRTYADDAFARLAFIARAKQLGCTLEEITDLIPLWEGQRCTPVQARLRDLVAEKIDDARQRATELGAFRAQLEQAAAQLSQHTPEGPCDRQCGCHSDPSVGSTASPELPIACTLSPADVPDRVEAWQQALREVTAREPLDDGVRLTLGPGAPVGEIASLAVAEQGCCAFLQFTLTVDARGRALEVRGPVDALGVVDALFGPP